MRTEIIEILQKKYPEYCLHHIDTADEILDLFNIRLTTSEKAALASKWSSERSEGDMDVDRECYYDYLMGMEEAERKIK